MGFYDNYVKLCNSVNKTPSAVAIEIGFSKSTVSRWKSGKQANDATLMKVADYFGCTIEDLTAEAPAPHIKLPGNNIFDALQLFAEELPQEAKKPTDKDDELSESHIKLKERIRALCFNNGINIPKLESALGFGNSTISKWDVVSPTLAKLQKVADYFGVSVSYLIGEEAKKPAPEGELNKAALLNAAETMSKEELIELLNKISKRLPEV